MNIKGLSRRDFLVTFLSAAGGAAGLFIASKKVWGEGGLSFNEWMQTVFKDLDTVHRLGQDYLKQFPEENDFDALIGMITDDELEGKYSETQLREKISSKIQSDYDNFNTVSLRGWILSRTEARILACFTIIS